MEIKMWTPERLGDARRGVIIVIKLQNMSFTVSLIRPDQAGSNRRVLCDPSHVVYCVFQLELIVF